MKMKTTTPPVRNSMSHSFGDCRPVAGLLIPLVLACFVLLPRARAVVPAPDGGYPGWNTAEGTNALFRLTNGIYNTALGGQALYSIAGGSYNTAVGLNALYSNNGWYNTADGYEAPVHNTNGSTNTAQGAFALFSNTGDGNTADGYKALYNTTAQGNTAIGIFAGYNVTTATNVICIGAAGANVNDSCYIENIYGATIDPATASPVAIDSSWKLGTVTSARRLKCDIKPMDNASEAILSLEPVTFPLQDRRQKHPLLWFSRRGCGKSESKSGRARQGRQTVQRALRRRERDVAQRVSQIA
jgi:hypothetical protein